MASSSAVSRRRLVIRTRLPAVPGSSGRTCSCPVASSSTSSTFLPARQSRQHPARASSPAGIASAPSPAARSKLASASAGSTGRCPGVCAWSGRKICPSGKRPASRCAACTARVVLPIPAIPPMAWIPTTPPVAAVSASPAVSRASSAPRPVNPEMSRGSVRVAAATEPLPRPGLLPAFAAGAVAWPRPQAMASKWARRGPVKPNASASSRAVSLRAVALTPRSRSLIDRTERLAASASSSCVSPASSRSCRSSGPKPCAGPSATGAHPSRVRSPTPRPPLPTQARDSVTSVLASCSRAGRTGTA